MWQFVANKYMTMNNTDILITKKCIIPWVHINIEPNGDVRPCNQSDFNCSPLGNVNKEDIKDIWNGENYKRLRQQMLDGIEPKECLGCYRAEQKFNNPLASKRFREIKRWMKYWDRTDTVEAEFKIPYVDLRYSNICNFKCRSCGPDASHAIAIELKIEPQILRFKLDSVAEMLDENIQFLEEVYFIGGEPLLMEEHYVLLQKLIDAGNTTVNLRYNSNISKLKFKGIDVVEMWKHFDNIHINASVDHYGEKLEYIRHGASWIETLENLKKIKSLPNVTLHIHCLLSVFNLLDITDIMQKFFDLNIVNSRTFVLCNLDNPSYYSIKSLHPELQLISKERIEKFLNDTPTIYSQLRVYLEHIVDTILEDNRWANSCKKFKKVTTKLDDIRGENFLNTFPDLGKQIHE
jgi:radical SAM protein with 4Fe4S-binding SPASM domain